MPVVSGMFHVDMIKLGTTKAYAVEYNIISMELLASIIALGPDTSIKNNPNIYSTCRLQLQARFVYSCNQYDYK